LSSAYTVKYVGEETVAGQKTYHLTLVPKNKDVRNQFSKIDLWMNETGAYPVQQKLTEPSGDYLLVTYTDVNLNPALKPEDLVLNLPKNVKREYPQRER
jgi:outer membrane lipoprotein-sorting protein